MVTIGNYSFEGAYSDVNSLKNQSGVYCILTKATSNTYDYDILDVGESEDVKTRVSSHDRSECWERNKNEGIIYAVYYCNESDRERIESELRRKYHDLPCGEE